MRRVTDDELMVVHACLMLIREELDRLFWNKYQEEIEWNDPFLNSGKRLEGDRCSIRAYNWDEETGNDKPNFECNGLYVTWYKWFARGLFAQTDRDEPLTCEYLAETMQIALNALPSMLDQIAPTKKG